MSKPQVQLVESKGFTINLPAISSPVTVWAESDEIVVLMRLTLRPRDNVMNIDLDITTSGDGAAVPSFNKDASS